MVFFLIDFDNLMVSLDPEKLPLLGIHHEPQSHPKEPQTPQNPRDIKLRGQSLPCLHENKVLMLLFPDAAAELSKHVIQEFLCLPLADTVPLLVIVLGKFNQLKVFLHLKLVLCALGDGLFLFSCSLLVGVEVPHEDVIEPLLGLVSSQLKQDVHEPHETTDVCQQMEQAVDSP